ncbi:hypothetical protein NMY22_g13881 [Coprinellus aureogranulatus]|nr:hypothetical protein NMY22_g13881 [Coprinellus aureogranulatus]
MSASKSLPGSPLPSHPSFDFDAEGNKAWGMLLAAQAYAEGEERSPYHYDEWILGVRVLGYVLLDLWEHRTLSIILRRAYGNVLQKVLEVGEADGGGLLGQALVRDTFKCAINQTYDSSADCFLEDFAPPFDTHWCACTQCEELIPIPLSSATRPNYYVEGEIQEEESKRTWDPDPLLMFLGVGEEVKTIAGANGGMGNLVTMQMCLRQSFDEFGWWLEEIEGKASTTPHTYHIRIADNKDWRRTEGFFDNPGLGPSEDGIFTFQLNPSIEKACMDALCVDAPTARLILLPNRELLAFRAVCARVATVSGAEEYKRRVRRETVGWWSN